MKKLLSLPLICILTISIVLFNPLSAAAVPVPVTDPPVTFTGTDLTAALEAAIGVSVGQITAVQTIANDENRESALIAGLNSSGNVFLVQYSLDFGNFYDWTGALNTAYPGVTRISAIGSMNGEYTWVIGGVNAEGHAFLVDACDFCVFGHSHNYADANVLEHSAVAGIGSYYLPGAPAIGKAGVTMSGPSGFFICDTEAETTTEVADAIMQTATGPVMWAGASSAFGLTSQTSTDFWLTGAGGGNVLAYGDAVAGQIYADLPGVVDTMDIDIGPLGWMLAGRGADGYMKLFYDTDYPTLITFVPMGPIALNLPQTMTDTVVGEAAPPYYIIGGTGGGKSHLYKYKTIGGLFIDFDYLVSGMGSLNAMETSALFGSAPTATGQSSTQIVVGASKIIVGGSGTAKLVLLTETPITSGEPTPSGSGSTTSCGDGTAKVEVSAGAINTGYNMLVEKVATGTPAVPGGFNLLGNSYEFECFDADGNPITTFDGPVTITIYYDEADLNGMSEDSLQIFWYNPATSAWEAMIPCYIDKVNNFVQIQTTHFSQFGILGMTQLPYTGL